MSARPTIKPRDRVITPADEVAIVVDVIDGAVPELELQYAGGLNPATSTLRIRESLCVPWPYSQPRPTPRRRRF